MAMVTEKIEMMRGRLAEHATGMGARFFGVADLSGVVEQGGDFLSSYPRALSIGIAMNDGIVDQLPRHTEESVAKFHDRVS